MSDVSNGGFDTQHPLLALKELKYYITWHDVMPSVLV